MTEIIAPLLKPELLIPIALALVTIWVTVHLNKRNNQRTDLKSEIEDPRSYPALIAKLTQNTTQAYDAALVTLMRRTDKIFGASNQYLRAFWICYKWNSIYPVLLLIVSWLIFDISRLGGAVVLEPGYTIFQRITASAFILIALTLSLAPNILVTPTQRILDKFIFAPRFPLQISWRRQTFLYLVRNRSVVGTFQFLLICFTISQLSAYLGFPEIIPVSINILLFAGVVGLVVGSFFVIIREKPIAVLGTLIFSVILIIYISREMLLSSGQEVLSTYLLFLMVLPLVNAVFDFLSLTASRYFINRLHNLALENRLTWRKSIGDITFDLIIAAILLVALVASVIFVLDLWQSNWPNSLTFDRHLYWSEIMSGNGAQLLIGGMLIITTILPTLIHGWWAARAIFTQQAREYTLAAERLNCSDLSVIEQNEIRVLIERGRGRGVVKATMVIVVLLAVLVGAPLGVALAL